MDSFVSFNVINTSSAKRNVKTENKHHLESSIILMECPDKKRKNEPPFSSDPKKEYQFFYADRCYTN